MLAAIKGVTDDNDLMIINRSGLTIRVPVSGIRVAGRATQGVRIINLRNGDSIAAVMSVPHNEEEEQSLDALVDAETNDQTVVVDEGIERLVEAAEQDVAEQKNEIE